MSRLNGGKKSKCSEQLARCGGRDAALDELDDVQRQRADGDDDGDLPHESRREHKSEVCIRSVAVSKQGKSAEEDTDQRIRAGKPC